MEVQNPICCGIDVHKRMLVACVRRVNGEGSVSKGSRQFKTTVAGLLELSTWLVEMECPIVAMESTGVYWRPVYHALNGAFAIVLGNAREIRQRPGKKTDKADAEWIAELLAHGLIENSFLPPPAIDGLRHLTRSRTGLVQSRTQAKNRVHKVLEDSGIKLASVVSDLFGKSARRMLEKLIQGERDPKVLAGLALGQLVKKLDELELALRGHFTETHAFLIKHGLALVDFLDTQIADIDAQVKVAIEPFCSEIGQLITIPGIDETAARIVIGEIGTDMSRFGSAGRISSWSGLAPGNNESAGKKKHGRTKDGNRWLRRVLCQCAWAARQGDTHIGRLFRRLEARIGGKKAAIAVAHKLLIIAFHLLKDGTFYEDERYANVTRKQQENRTQYLIRQIQRAGYTVTPPPEAAA